MSQPAIAKGHNSTSAMRRQDEAKFFDVMLALVGFFIWNTRKLSVRYLFGIKAGIIVELRGLFKASGSKLYRQGTPVHGIIARSRACPR
ncbi:MAG: hypothetical protein Q7T29_02655 [Gallionella sp.]|nr:hypothetical protein [Gallionella sp.]